VQLIRKVRWKATLVGVLLMAIAIYVCSANRTNYPARAEFRRIKIGMSEGETLAILGLPQKVLSQFEPIGMPPDPRPAKKVLIYRSEANEQHYFYRCEIGIDEGGKVVEQRGGMDREVGIIERIRKWFPRLSTTKELGANEGGRRKRTKERRTQRTQLVSMSHPGSGPGGWRAGLTKTGRNS
jgi:hypothetical protein